MKSVMRRMALPGAIFMSSWVAAHASEPIVPTRSTADPAPMVHDGTV